MKSPWLSGLTIGKQYDVVKSLFLDSDFNRIWKPNFIANAEEYIIINDSSCEWNYSSKFFEKLEDMRDRKLKELLYGSDM